MAFLRFILIFILITLLLRLIGRFLFVRLMKNWQSKMGGQFNQPQERPKGEVTIENKKAAKNGTKSSEKPGEYIDYEEIK